MNSIEANGLRFAYRQAGRGPLILLLGDARVWDALLPALAAAGYRGVAPIPRANADSDTLGRDALALIAALGEPAAIVIGHGFGASAAYAAAALGPEHIRLLVTLALPHPHGLRRRARLAWLVRNWRAPRAVRAAMLRPAGALRLPIRVPTVAFAGEHDRVLPPRAFERARHCFAASYEVVQVPGDHRLHRQPEFAGELIQSLRDHEARIL